MTAKFKALSIALCTFAMTLGNASATEYKSEYTISVLGLNVGKSSFNTKITGNKYTINGSLRASGVARLFSSTTGNLVATGSVSSKKITASAFDVRYKEGKKSKRTTISFRNGNVVKTTNVPKTKKKGAWIEVEKSHLRNVLDPIAAILVPAKSLRSVCNNTLKVYDGAMRVDFPMRYVRTIPFSTKGYKGDAVTCRATVKPISGYNSNKKDIRWMREKGYAEISFVPVGKTGLYAPTVAKIKTRLGLVTIRAKRFQTLTK